MKIIPAIDVLDGKCVRLSQGDYNRKKVYDQDPLDIAIELDQLGYEYLHLVDLNGAKKHTPRNLLTLNQIALNTSLKVDFGGGVKSEDSLIQAIRSGAHQVNIGSLSARNPTLVKYWVMKYGSDKIIIGADVKDGKIAINGWTKITDISIFDFINDFMDDGATDFVCTDIAKDGMMEGCSIDLYRQILNYFPGLHLIASGGVTTIDEIKELEQMGIYGVIIGKAFYEGLIDRQELISLYAPSK